jgi:hypothetical protein
LVNKIKKQKKARGQAQRAHPQARQAHPRATIGTSDPASTQPDPASTPLDPASAPPPELKVGTLPDPRWGLERCAPTSSQAAARGAAAPKPEGVGARRRRRGGGGRGGSGEAVVVLAPAGSVEVATPPWLGHRAALTTATVQLRSRGDPVLASRPPCLVTPSLRKKPNAYHICARIKFTHI